MRLSELLSERVISENVQDRFFGVHAIFNKQQIYKQRQAQIDEKSSK